jgi:hypothetical protein
MSSVTRILTASNAEGQGAARSDATTSVVFEAVSNAS